jgi:hypothetical protein
LRRKGILALAAIAALMLATGVAAAAKTYKTDIRVRVVVQNADNTDDMFAGDLRTNSKCLADRKVKFSKETDSGFKLLDTDRSSANGAWAVRGNLRGTPTVKLQVTKDTRKNGKVVCKGRAGTISPSKSKY